jgi:hypothetical protein
LYDDFQNSVFSKLLHTGLIIVYNLKQKLEKPKTVTFHSLSVLPSTWSGRKNNKYSEKGDTNTHKILRRPDMGLRSDGSSDLGGASTTFIEPINQVEGISMER